MMKLFLLLLMPLIFTTPIQAFDLNDFKNNRSSPNIKSIQVAQSCGWWAIIDKDNDGKGPPDLSHDRKTARMLARRYGGKIFSATDRNSVGGDLSTFHLADTPEGIVNGTARGDYKVLLGPFRTKKRVKAAIARLKLDKWTYVDNPCDDESLVIDKG